MKKKLLYSRIEGWPTIYQLSHMHVRHLNTSHLRQTPLHHGNAPLRMPQHFAHLFMVLFWIYLAASSYLSRQLSWPYDCGVWKSKKGAFGVHAKVHQHE
jgi:hypothetical protein